jgi:hypothetical protein
MKSAMVSRFSRYDCILGRDFVLCVSLIPVADRLDDGMVGLGIGPADQRRLRSQLVRGSS